MGSEILQNYIISQDLFEIVEKVTKLLLPLLFLLNCEVVCPLLGRHLHTLITVVRGLAQLLV